jgi:tRNA nucleotidyltransferase (CCA-adding enzyme)
MKSFLSHLNESMVDDLLSTHVRKAIKRSGGKIYQIGGVVRDELLGKISKDLDLLVVGVELDDLGKILKPFGKVNMVGKSFGILKFVPTGSTEDEDIDISVPRIDSKSTGAGHKDFEVQLGKGITLQQDQLRRDFWINQLAKDVDTGEIVDTDGKGMKDIKNKQIRMISPTSFIDDPLRMLRAVQFAARFEFKIERETFKQMQQQAKTIATVSADRFTEEFKKLFTKSKSPSHGVKIMFSSGLMKNIFASAKLNSIDLDTIDELDKKSFAAFMGIMLVDYGDKARAVSKSVAKLSNKDADSVQSIVDFIRNENKIMDDMVELVKFSQKNDKLIIDKYLEAKGKKTLTSVLSSLRVKNIKDLPIDGKDISGMGFEGKMIGVILNFALEFAVRNNTKVKAKIINAIKAEYG